MGRAPARPRAPRRQLLARGLRAEPRAPAPVASLDIAVDDLLELLDAVSPDRPAIVAGHSLGGWLAVRAAARRPTDIAGAALLDSSHPAELARSSRQAQGQA